MTVHQSFDKNTVPAPRPTYLRVSDGSAHGPNQPFSQPVNRVVFSLTWLNQPCIQPMPAGSVGRNDYHILTRKWALCLWALFNITLVIFANLTDLTICSLCIATGQCYTLNLYIYTYIYMHILGFCILPGYGGPCTRLS